MEDKIMAILKACFFEFCDIVGDSPCGCDACPYGGRNTEDNEDGCMEAYINDKISKEGFYEAFESFKREQNKPCSEDNALPEHYKRSLYNAFTGGKG